MKYDVFISYRRDGGFEIANLIASKLKIAGYRVFLDIHAMHAGDFSDQLKEKVCGCKDFIWILSTNHESKTLYYRDGTDYYRDEICWAIENRCNIIPVKLDGFTFPNSMPDCICNAIETYNLGLDIYKLQAIEANKNQYFDAAISELRKCLVSLPIILYKWIASIVSAIIVVAIMLGLLFSRSSEQSCTMKFIEEPNSLPFKGADVELFIDSKSLGVKHLYRVDEEIIYTNISCNFNKHAILKLSGEGLKDIFDTIKLNPKIIVKLKRDNSYSEYWGYIYDSVTNEPVVDAIVLLGKKFKTNTNEQGFFSFSLPLCEQELYKEMHVSKKGYRSFYDSEVYPGESKFHMIKK